MRVTVEIELHPNQRDGGGWKFTFKGEERLVRDKRVRWVATSVREALTHFKAEEVLDIRITTDI